MIGLIGAAGFEDGKGSANQFVQDGHNDAHFGVPLGNRTF